VVLPDDADVLMSAALPYRFDSSPVVKLILRGVLGLLLLVIVPGLLYSLLVSRDHGAAVLLLVTGLIVIYFGRLFLRNLEASHGTITADTVLVEPGVLYGIRLHGPSGRFPLESFEAVRVERISPLAWAPGGPHERVSLMGKKGTPDILIAKTSDEAGRALGRDLSAVLGLRYQEESAPY
jgi:hypothetical protein